MRGMYSSSGIVVVIRWTCSMRGLKTKLKILSLSILQKEAEVYVRGED